MPNRRRAVPAIGAALALLLGAGCGPGATDPVPGCGRIADRANLDCNDPDVESAQRIVAAMSLEEKVQQMSGPVYNPNNMFDQQDNERLGVPGLKYMDGPRGVRWYNTDYGTTVFPVAVARASSWNLELERRIGKAMAREMRYLGRHILLAPTINQVMHPRWGRSQETYGEDSFLLGELGASFIRGAQYDPTVIDPAEPDFPAEDTYRVQACAKHFAANNIEDTRIYVNAVIDERTLREVYLPHFKKAVDADVSCFMTSYNRVNGSYAGYSKSLVRSVLKQEWKYRGYVISDWFAKGSTLASPEAGLDVEMPFSSGQFPSMFDSAYYYGPALIAAVNGGQVDASYVDEAALRIVHQKVKNGIVKHDLPWTPWLTKSDDARTLALESARQGMVLLKNGLEQGLADDVLPLDRDALTQIAVVGKFANSENMGDKGSSDARVIDGEMVVTPFEGIRDAFAGAGRTVLTHPTVAGNEDALRTSDVIVVVSAYHYADLARSSSGEEGEWKDRISLDLPARDLANIRDAVALKSANPDLKLVVVMKSGGAVVVDDWIGGADAVVMSWFGGMSEGTALAEILFGDISPSGKTVQSFPRKESDLPAFLNTTRGSVEYDYYHGYRLLDRRDIEPRYPFGFGLSYTSFAYSNLQIEDATIGTDGVLTVRVDVTNTGARKGSEVVQLYVGYANTGLTSGWGRPVKELKAFARLEDLEPGATVTVELEVDAAELAYWDTAARRFVVEKMEHQLYVGPSADAKDPNMLKAGFLID